MSAPADVDSLSDDAAEPEQQPRKKPKLEPTPKVLPKKKLAPTKPKATAKPKADPKADPATPTAVPELPTEPEHADNTAGSEEAAVAPQAKATMKRPAAAKGVLKKPSASSANTSKPKGSLKAYKCYYKAGNAYGLKLGEKQLLQAVFGQIVSNRVMFTNYKQPNHTRKPSHAPYR